MQDESKEHTADYVYTDEEHIAISRFNEYYGEGNTSNYLTSTGIRALYAGLLRNAEIVTYTLTNVDTGEIIPDDNGNGVREFYRANKAYAAGGSSIPSQVLLEMRTDQLGLAANGKYRLDFTFYFSYEDYVNGTFTDEDGNLYGVYKDNTFSMNFYVDYEAPILTDSRIRFQDRTDENNKVTQKVYLDLDIFDNHYPQAVLLCYSSNGSVDSGETNSVRLATEYITPVINPRRNTTNTVTIDITDIYEDYKGGLFVEIQDYALNSNMYYINTDYSQTSSVCPSDFKLMLDGKEITELTIEKNTVTKLSLSNLGSANLSNFIWETNDPNIVAIKNGEVYGVSEGTTRITVRGGNNRSQSIRVTVIDGDNQLKTPTVSFGTMLNYNEVPVKADGIVSVNPAQQFKLNIVSDPWYYPLQNLNFIWSSSDEELATVDQNGNVTVLYEGDKVKNVTISATAEGYSACAARVVLSIRDPYTISNGALTRYRGWGGVLNEDGVRVLEIPSDRSIMSIADEAFKECENVEIVIIPKGVTSIGERAFIDCKNLKEIYFISQEAKTPADSSLTIIHSDAFSGCTSLEKVDLSNCKVITLDRSVFAGCTALKEVVKMTAIGTMYTSAFSGCTSLERADISKLHIAFSGIFMGCTSLKEVVISETTAMGAYM
ncbi:MAG: leucine-rich repeat protein, partial [Clostridia bacterium]|nr:leucine-rich repeat protein [Clostridia bacterium]